ncbi:MAG: zinc ABC transporter substrate-binding protein [Sedimenticola sp.]|nr:zinc ABC transporter substrate-binding protein [Sedimenticola sp.]
MSTVMRYLSLLLLLLVPFSCALATPLSVYVSILPQKYIVERVGGEHVRVTVLVGPGQSPETFEPRPRQMAGLGEAALFYRIGVPFEEAWIDTIRSTNPRMALLDARQGVTLREMEPAGGHHHDFDHHHAAHQPDPHIWLDPANVRVMATHLRDQLVVLDPQHADQYRANHDRLAEELTVLEKRLRDQLAPYKGRKFMVYHPSWGYFADAFGLRQLPIESEGKEPGAHTLARLIGEAQKQGVRVVFVQRQFALRQARALAGQIGARLVSLDPLAEDYLVNLQRIADAISEAYR